tara:strand:- start:4143 stop:4781 length:639 start_codon:yes stop_codon:yes gene_type:complete
MKEVVIIDLGIGNLYSLKSALEHLNYKPLLTDDIKKISKSSQIILPGDGAFKYAMDIMKKKKIYDTMQLIDFKKIKLLGICLGMQLLLDSSLEFEKCDGLGLIKGKNIRLCDKGTKSEKLDIPHINWRSIEISSKKFEKDNLFETIHKDDEFYFIHSFMAKPLDENNLIATYNYGGNKVPAIIKRDLIYGFQFHPEKSAEPGLKLLDQFLKL